MNINDLYKKVAEFEKNISEAALEKSHCQNKCSRCCYVDLSVFNLEAENIKNWFLALDDSQKNTLRAKWKLPLKETLNFHNEMVSSCAFLSEESCSIYEARPLICRTQGLALKFKEEMSEFLDICPLNEEMLEVISQKEILNLDLLNMILVQLEQMHSGANSVERVKLSELKASLL